MDDEAVAGTEGRVEIEPGYWIGKDGFVFSEFSGRLLTNQKNYRGYLVVKLTGAKWKLLHRLVGMAFVPGMTEARNQINHKDGNKENNSPENLEWVTASENCKHSHATGLQSPPVWSDESKEKMASKHRGRKCTDEQKKKMSEARKGKGTAPKSLEHRMKISAALKGRKK